MSLTAGVRLGPYEILAPLGSGGMGEVYRARDSRLDRLVALKVLPAHLSTDPELQQRFAREARAISSLNHPNICALYDVGEARAPDATSAAAEPIRFLVMELLEGESLADRLATGPLPLDVALQRGIELADALSAAHRRGIVHRDLKPGNIVLTKAGAKLLDFGLAKSGPVVGVAGGPASPTALATTPPALTARGTILGTFHYMAPEQLEGLDADARADIFAFGAVLYEMISGRRPFDGKSQASLIGAILKDQPPALSSVAPLATPALDRVIAKCLAKDPEDRWQDARDLRDELKWIAGSGSAAAVPARDVKGRSRERLAWTLLAAALVGVGALAVPYFRPTAVVARSVVRFTLAPPDGLSFAPVTAPVAPFPAVSPDGRRLAFIATRPGEAPSLWIRSLDSLDERPLDGTTVRTDTLSPALPFWSPDSRSIGFFADGKLKRVDLDGSAPRTICDAPQSGGGSWNANGTILFASKIDEGLYRVDANGGVPVPVTTPDTARGEISHSNPAFLPDGRYVLFWVRSAAPSIHLGSIDSPETTPLFESDSRPVYAGGSILFVRQGRLFAQRFDAARRQIEGDPVLVADDVRTFVLNGRSAFAASDEVLVYRTGGSRSGRPLAWYDRTGRLITPVSDAATSSANMTLGGDERQLIVPMGEGSGRDLWKIDLERGTRSRVTSDPNDESAPVTSPDGRLVVFASDRSGLGDLYRKRTDGLGDDELLVQSTERKFATDWSSNWITFTVIDPERNDDIWVLPVDGEAKPYLQTPFRERNGRLSPDERWMAYTSDEDGQDAIYVRSFPNADGGRWRVSGGGGVSPRWRADGKEILYVDGGGRIVAVPVALGERSPGLGAPQVLFQSGSLVGAGYAISRNGQRFLLPVPGRGDERNTPLTVVLNWRGLLVR